MTFEQAGTNWVCSRRRYMAQQTQHLKEEARVMAAVPGWVVGENVYHSGRWMKPSNGKLEAEY